MSQGDDGSPRQQPAAGDDQYTQLMTEQCDPVLVSDHGREPGSNRETKAVAGQQQCGGKRVHRFSVPGGVLGSPEPAAGGG